MGATTTIDEVIDEEDEKKRYPSWAEEWLGSMFRQTYSKTSGITITLGRTLLHV